jgi:hypothetical protein
MVFSFNLAVIAENAIHLLIDQVVASLKMELDVSLFKKSLF